MLIEESTLINRLIATQSHWIGGNRKRSKHSTNADQKSLEAVFSIAICRHSGDKWQSKTMFLKIVNLCSSIVLAFSIAAYPVWQGSNLLPDSEVSVSFGYVYSAAEGGFEHVF